MLYNEETDSWRCAFDTHRAVEARDCSTRRIRARMGSSGAMVATRRPQYTSCRRHAGRSVSPVDARQAHVQRLNRLNSMGLSLAQTEDLIPVFNQLYSLEAQYEQRKEAIVTQMAPLLADKREMLIGGEKV